MNNKKIFDIKKYDKLTEVEKDILEKINLDPDFFINNNIITIGKKYYSSKSCISRVSQKIGFTHIIDMKYYVRSQMVLQDLYKIESEENTQERLNNLKAYNIYAIHESLNTIKINDIKLISKKIINAKKNFLYGLVSSYLPAFELTQNLWRLGINCIATNDIHNLLLTLASATNKDFLILFSKAAKSKEIKFLITTANEFNIPTLLITNNKEDSLKVDYKIIIEDILKNHRIIATSSKIAMLVISDLIYYEIYNTLEDTEEKLNKSNKLLKKWKEYY